MRTEEKKVSVIIPVFNAEKTITETVESVQKQTYQNLEIILVDDGSADRSRDVCTQIAQSDCRITVRSKQNGGASSARNMGLDSAGGDCILFVDSDDLLPSDSVEKLVSAIERSGSDYCAGSILASNSKRSFPNLDKEIVFKAQPEDLLGYLTCVGSYSPYAKLFRRAVIEENRIRFDEGLLCSEDALFIRQYLRYSKAATLIPETVYYYNYYSENSLSKRTYKDFAGYYIRKLDALAELLSVLSLTDERKEGFLKERAVNGLKISSFHYLNSNYPEKEKNDCLRDALVLFEPWLKSAAEIRDPALNRWWNRYGKYAAAENAGAFIKAMKNSFQWQSHIRDIKERVKRAARDC